MADEGRKSVKVGFIGLGSQGAPMAQRLIEAGYSVVLWARRPESLVPFSDTAAQTVASIGELGALADHVGICVVDDAGVQQVCDELIPAMRPGSRIAIHSTIHPGTCVALAKQAGSRRISLIDAPVSGGGPAAAVGKLTVMVGGDESAVAAARSILESFAGVILHLGGIGAGLKAKLVNNALMAANMALAHQALAAGSALGIDRAALIQLVKVSSGHSYAFDVYARMPDPCAFGHGARLLSKDVRLLGEVLGAEPSFRALRDAAVPFLDFVQAKPDQSGDST